MKLTKRPFIVVILGSLTLILSSIIIPNSASAGEIKATYVTISWDDNSFYEPPAVSTGNCTSYYFNVTVTNRDKILMAYIHIKNKYGDKLGDAVVSRLATGTV